MKHTKEAVAKDDVILRFSAGNGASGFEVRIASRHGEQTLPALIGGIKPYLAEGVTLTGLVETPSRFAK